MFGRKPSLGTPETAAVLIENNAASCAPHPAPTVGYLVAVFPSMVKVLVPSLEERMGTAANDRCVTLHKPVSVISSPHSTHNI